MADTFYIKRGDTSPALRATLSPATVNLAGCSVVFNMRSKSGSVPVVNRAAAVVVTESDPAVVEYSWGALDTTTAGLYVGEFEVTYADASVETFPNSGYFEILVTPDIA